MYCKQGRHWSISVPSTEPAINQNASVNQLLFGTACNFPAYTQCADVCVRPVEPTNFIHVLQITVPSHLSAVRIYTGAEAYPLLSPHHLWNDAPRGRRPHTVLYCPVCMLLKNSPQRTEWQHCGSTGGVVWPLRSDHILYFVPYPPPRPIAMRSCNIPTKVYTNQQRPTAKSIHPTCFYRAVWFSNHGHHLPRHCSERRWTPFCMQSMCARPCAACLPYICSCVGPSSVSSLRASTRLFATPCNYSQNMTSRASRSPSGRSFHSLPWAFRVQLCCYGSWCVDGLHQDLAIMTRCCIWQTASYSTVDVQLCLSRKSPRLTDFAWSSVTVCWKSI